MREFILYASTADEEIQPKNLPYGRYDMIARCINAALWKSHTLREAAIHVVLGRARKTKIVTVTDQIKHVSPDERSIALWIKKIIEKQQNPGITLQELSFDKLLKSMKKRNLYYLLEEGKDIQEVEIKQDPVFILGDHIGLPDKEEKKVKKIATALSLGPESYLASQCITYINIELDRREKNMVF